MSKTGVEDFEKSLKFALSAPGTNRLKYSNYCRQIKLTWRNYNSPAICLANVIEEANKYNISSLWGKNNELL
jgi:hypothetical protein